VLGVVSVKQTVVLFALLALTIEGCGPNEHANKASPSAVAAGSTIHRPPASQGSGMTTINELREKVLAMQRLLDTPPLQRPGVVILSGKSDPSLTVSEDRQSVSGPLSNDHYLRKTGFDGPEPSKRYNFGRKSAGIIVSGGYQNLSSEDRNTFIIEIMSAQLGDIAPELAKYGGQRPLTRTEYDLSGLVPYFDAFRLNQPHPDQIKTIVIDARDEHIAISNLNRMLSQARRDESRLRMGFKVEKRQP
jgi:hypothetical protein